MNNNTGDYEKSFDELMGQNFINVMGCLVERTDGGYIWAGVYYDSFDLLCKAITRTHKVIGNSLIPRPKPSLYKKFRFWLLGK